MVGDDRRSVTALPPGRSRGRDRELGGRSGAATEALARLGYAVAYLLDQAVGVLGQPDAAQPEGHVQERGQLSVEDVLEHDVL